MIGRDFIFVHFAKGWIKLNLDGVVKSGSSHVNPKGDVHDTNRKGVEIWKFLPRAEVSGVSGNGCW